MSSNQWIQHVKKYQSEHGCNYKEAMKGAKATYTKKSKPKGKGKKSQQGEGFFGDLASSFSRAVQDPSKLVTGYTKLTDAYGGDAFLPWGKLGAIQAVKSFTNEKDPRYKAMHATFDEGVKPIELLTKLDPTGASGKVIGGVKGAGIGRYLNPLNIMKDGAKIQAKKDHAEIERLKLMLKNEKLESKLKGAGKKKKKKKN